jgi:hypothetical protein
MPCLPLIQGDPLVRAHLEEQHVLEVESDSNVPVHTHALEATYSMCVHRAF